MTDIVGVGAEDYAAVLEGLGKRGERPFPKLLLDRKRLTAFGPQRAGALVEFCRDETEVGRLLEAGRGFAKEAGAGLAFYRQVVPRAGPTSAGVLHDLLRNPDLAPLIVERLLKASGPEWGWGRDPGSYSWPADIEKHEGPYVWSGIDWDRCKVPPLRELLVPFAEDPRPEIASVAVFAATAAGTEEATKALRRALRSDRPWVREVALVELVRREPDGEMLLRDFARRADFAKEDYEAVENALEGLKAPARTALVLELLSQGKDEWSDLWGVLHELAPKECVEHALRQAKSPGGPQHQCAAIDVLTRVDDPRRIELFREVLRGQNLRAVREVLQAVGEQYLVELGPEALTQLRNPDDDTRELAANAIERLKFYAEAKKAFDK